MKLLSLSNVGLYPNQAIRSCFLHGNLKTTASADGNNKQPQQTENNPLASYFVTNDLWIGYKTYT